MEYCCKPFLSHLGNIYYTGDKFEKVTSENAFSSLSPIHLYPRMYHSTQEQSLFQSAYNRAKLDFSPDWNLVTSHHRLEMSFFRSILEPGMLKFQIWHANVVSSFPSFFYKFVPSSNLPVERQGAVFPPDTSQIILASGIHCTTLEEKKLDPVLTRV